MENELVKIEKELSKLESNIEDKIKYFAELRTQEITYFLEKILFASDQQNHSEK